MSMTTGTATADTATAVTGTAVTGTLAPPEREILAPIETGPTRGSAGEGPDAPDTPVPAAAPPRRRRRRNRLRELPAAPRPPRPRDTRWWLGVAIIVLSSITLTFIVHVAVISQLQHLRAQSGNFDTLRDTLARAETPVGQLDSGGQLVSPGTPVALLDIPDLGLTETVVEGTSSQALRAGPGHRRDTVLPGQPGTSVIMGRQTTYGGPFGALHELKLGSEITVTTGQGVHTFRVFSLRRGGESEPQPLASGAGRLQLITGSGLALAPSGVLYVDAELVSEVQPASMRVLGEQGLPPSEHAMGSDGGAWVLAGFMVLVFAQASALVIWAWRRWGREPTWMVGLPLLLCLALLTSDSVMNAMPNLL